MTVRDRHLEVLALPSRDLDRLRAAFGSDVARHFGMDFTVTDAAAPKRVGILVWS